VVARTVFLKNGDFEIVNAPPNATTEEIIQLVNEKRGLTGRSRESYSDLVARRNERSQRLKEELEQARAAATVTRDPSMVENLYAGLGTGFTGVGETSALGIATLLEEEDELAARRKIQSAAEGVREFIGAEGGDPDSIVYGVGQALGSIAGITAPLAGLAVAGAPGLATAGAGLALTGALGRGEGSERAREEGATEEERNTAANRATVVGFLDILPISRFVKLIDMPKVAKLADTFGAENVNTLGSRVRNAFKTGGAEGAQEATTEFLQNAIESGYNVDQDLVEGLAPAAGYGAGAGAIVQTIVDLFTKGRRIGEARRPEDVEDVENVEQLPLLPKEEQTVEDILDSGDTDALNTIDIDQLRSVLFNEEARKANVQRDDEIKGLLPPPTPPSITVTPEGEARTSEQQQAVQKEQRIQALEDERILGDMPPAEVRGDVTQEEQVQETPAQEAPLPSIQVDQDNPEVAKSIQVLKSQINQDPELRREFQENPRRFMERIEQDETTGVVTLKPFETTTQPDAVQDTDTLESIAAEVEAEVNQLKETIDLEDVKMYAQENQVPINQARDILAREQFRVREAEQLAALTKKEPKVEFKLSALDQKGLNAYNRNAKEKNTPQITEEQYVANKYDLDPKGYMDRQSAVRADKEILDDFASYYNQVAPEGVRQIAENQTRGFGKLIKGAVKEVNKTTGIKLKNDPFTGADKGVLLELVKGKTPTKTKAAGNAAKAKTYFSKTQNPVDALYLAIRHKVDEKGTKQALKFDPDDPKAKSFKKDLIKDGTYEDLPADAKQAVDDLDVFESGTNQKSAEQTLDYVKENFPAVREWVEQVELVSKTEKASAAASTANILTDVDLTETTIAVGRKKTEAAASEVKDIDAQQYQLDKFLKTIDEMTKARPSLADAIALDQPLNPSVEFLLQKGQLKLALQLMRMPEYEADAKIRKMASSLYPVIGKTEVRIQSGKEFKGTVSKLFGEDIPARGLYDPKVDTVYLSTDTTKPGLNGMNAATLLHEVAHAATLKSISNRKLPSTKRLDRLFKYAKKHLNSVYGTENLEEFVAEAFSNPRFQEQLASLWIPKKVSFSKEGISNAWNNFVDWVAELWGFKPRNVNNVLDETTSFIDRILSGNRVGDYGPVLMAAETSGAMGKNIDALFKAQQKAAQAENAKDVQNFTDNVKNVLSTSPSLVKRAALYGMNTRMLSQIGDAMNLPQFSELNKLVGEQEGTIQRETDRVKVTAVELAKWEKAHPDKVKSFNDLVHFSSIEGVDLRKKASEYGGEKLEWYNDNIDAYKKLGEAGRTQYDAVFKLYKGVLDTMQENILAPIETFVEDAGSRKRISTLIKEKLFSAATIDPYVPLTREGNNWLQYDVDGETVYQAFSTDGARSRFAMQLNDDPEVTNVIPFDGVKKYDKKNISSNSALGQIVGELNKYKVDQTVIDRMIQLYIESMPDSSYVKSLQTRKNDAGFQNSVLRGINIKAFEMVRQAVNIKYTRSMYRLKDNLTEELTKIEKEANVARAKEEGSAVRVKFEKEYGDPDSLLFASDSLSALAETFDKRAQQASSPADSVADRIAIGANKLAFIGTMGLNVSSSLLQLAGVPMVLYPYLAAKTSWRSAAGDIGAASKFFSGSGLDRAVVSANEQNAIFKESYIGAPSIDNYYKADKDGNLSIRKDIKLNNNPKEVFYTRRDKDGRIVQKLTQKEFVEEMLPLVRTAANRGILNRTIHSEMMGLDISGQKESSTVSQLWNDFNTMMAYPFHIGDRAQRQVSLVSAYLAEMERLTNAPNKTKGEQNLSPDEIKNLAIETAMSDMEQTGGTNLLGQAPPVAQKHIGRVMMMFRTYGLTIYYHQVKMALDYFKAAKRGDEQARRIALRQMLGTLGLTAAMSGIAGTTFYGMFIGVLNALTDDEDERMDSKIREMIGEGYYKGGVNYVMAQLGVPIDVSARIGLANLLISSDRYDFGNSVEETIFDELGGAAWSTLSRAGRGGLKILDGEVQRGIEDILPASVRNMTQAYRFANEGVLTRRGDPITQTDFNGGTIAAKFFGFAPAEYTRAQESAQDKKRVDKAVSAKRSKLLKKYYIAYRKNDIRGLMEVEKDIADFNKRHSSKGPKVPISRDTIKKSLKGHMNTSEKMFNGVVLTDSMRDVLTSSVADYE
jgi:hypothetical protein